MIIQILVAGDPSNMIEFHSKMSLLLNKLNGDSDQTVYSCLDNHYNDIEREAKKRKLKISKWDTTKKEWI